MITRRQAIFIAVWVAFPFVVFLALFLINPAYERKLFEPLGPIHGISALISLEILHGLVLFGGFWILNNRRVDPPDSNPKKPRGPAILLIILTLFTCTLPSLWLALLYPSALIIFQGGCRGC